MRTDETGNESNEEKSMRSSWTNNELGKTQMHARGNIYIQFAGIKTEPSNPECCSVAELGTLANTFLESKHSIQTCGTGVHITLVHKL